MEKAVNNSFFIVFILIFFISSCNENKKEVIEFESIQPKSSPKENKSNKPSSTYSWDTSLLTYFTNYSNNSLIDSIKRISLIQIPDRISLKSTDKFSLYFNNDSTAYYHWKYSDSLSTKNALYNWLDCFGESCNSIKLNEKKQFQKAPFLLFIGEKNMIFISSSKKAILRIWFDFIKLKYAKETWRTVIEQKQNNTANWYSIVDDEFIMINNQ